MRLTTAIHSAVRIRTVPLCLVVLVTLVAAPAAPHAEEQKLSAAEISEVLGGNTLEGKWRGNFYRQYFNTRGTTSYIEAGWSRSMRGKWRVDETKNLYCEEFSGVGIRCFDVYRDAETIIMIVPKTGQETRAKLLPGKQMNW